MLNFFLSFDLRVLSKCSSFLCLRKANSTIDQHKCKDHDKCHEVWILLFFAIECGCDLLHQCMCGRPQIGEIQVQVHPHRRVHSGDGARVSGASGVGSEAVDPSGRPLPVGPSGHVQEGSQLWPQPLHVRATGGVGYSTHPTTSAVQDAPFTQSLPLQRVLRGVPTERSQRRSTLNSLSFDRD